ncbi:MAG: NYN domain-containing protein [Melioribacteraceae bacterium]|nr:NYN domain-containing protein [Melioribacteraceae bacterium]
MIQKYIIDGNNLIGKIDSLWKLQNGDKQMSRVKLVKLIDQHFGSKKINISLHFDGFSGDAIPSSVSKINYSNNKSADSQIKKEIDSSLSRHTIAVVSSDHSVQNYAKVNGCKIIKSEEFAKKLKKKNSGLSEEAIAKSISDDEIKKMFGL